MLNFIISVSVLSTMLGPVGQIGPRQPVLEDTRDVFYLIDALVHQPDCQISQPCNLRSSPFKRAAVFCTATVRVPR